MATRAPQNNTSSTFLYDALNRVTNVTHNFTGATGTLAYAYDEVGNRKYMQRGNGLTDGFGYDLNSQVTSFRRNGTLTGGTVTGGTLTSLVFDASGNRTSVVENGTTTSYPSANNLNQYPSVGGKGATYDGKGNLYSYDGWTYTYDALYRLTAATGPGVTANFYYDGLNRQVARTITGGTTKFSVWDGWNLYAEYDPNKVQTNRWIRAGNDLIRSPSPEGVYYYPDAAGSTIFLADIYGNLLERYTYDLSGAPSFADAAGTALPGGSNYAVENLFNGQKWYAPLGLYDLRYRFFKPDWGRFLQPDPIGFAGDPANLYRYCGNNPVNWSDPSGLDPIPEMPRETVTGRPVPQEHIDNGGVSRQGSGAGPFGGFVATVGGGEFIERVNRDLDRQRQENQAKNSSPPASVMMAGTAATAAGGSIATGGSILEGGLLAEIMSNPAVLMLALPFVMTGDSGPPQIGLYHYSQYQFTGVVLPGNSYTTIQGMNSLQASAALGIPPPAYQYNVTVNRNQAVYMGPVPASRWGFGGAPWYIVPGPGPISSVQPVPQVPPPGR